MQNLILGIDIGTSSCKVAVFNTDGEVIAQSSQNYKVYYKEENYVEQNPEDWWEMICKAIKEVLYTSKIDAKDICVVGVDGQSWSSIMVDKEGEVLAPNPIWLDARATSICDEFNEKLGNEIFNIAGNPFEPTYTTPKIIWFKRNMPQVYNNTYKILQSNSYIVYKLTGKFSHDLSQGYGLHFFDMQKGVWNLDLAKEFGIDLNLMPDIMDCHSIVGNINMKAAELTGLREGTPVVAGGLDAAAATLGAGIVKKGQTQEQGGQAGGMSICLDEYKPHKKLIMGRHLIPGLWLLQGGTVGGGGTLNWLKNNVMEDTDFEVMTKLASEIPALSEGLIFLPYMAGERSPIWDKNSKGVYFGLDYKKDKRHLIRATMEGVAYSLLHNIKTAEEADVYVDTLNAVGGAANSHVWTQIKADVTGKTINVPSSDTATTKGVAILAGVGAGIYKDFEDGVNKTVKIEKTYIPNMEKYEKYQKGYAIYREIYENLKSTMNKTIN